MQTIFCAFTNIPDADAAIHSLQDKQIDPGRMNVLVQATAAKSNLDQVNMARVHVDATNAIDDRELSGLALLVANEQPVEVRGIGPVLAGGELATILANATVASNQTGEDVQSMFIDYGIAPATAKTYEQTIEQGGALLWVRDEDEQIRTAAGILRRHNAQDVMTN
ncbi:MAG: hypothetical protein KDE19_06015 [Caldilineaceae bacterium]|nr:hypothetical protein [Caldilineaceae bacterium]